MLVKGKKSEFVMTKTYVTKKNTGDQGRSFSSHLSLIFRKQITLNETRDIVRDVKRQTNEIDIGIENLNEDMDEERKIATQQNRELDKETVSASKI